MILDADVLNGILDYLKHLGISILYYPGPIEFCNVSLSILSYFRLKNAINNLKLKNIKYML